MKGNKGYLKIMKFLLYSKSIILLIMLSSFIVQHQNNLILQTTNL